MKSRFKNKTIWITGASDGIGKALALEFSKFDTNLILSGRRINELEEVSKLCQNNGSKANVLTFDLSESLEVINAAEHVISAYGGVDILINNGGITQRSLLINTPLSVDRKVMEIDYFSGVILTKMMLPLMIKKGYGHIVAMSSITGLFGFPLRSAYSAAKHAMVGFYETLWAELHPQGIDVTIACPGRIKTAISVSAITETGEKWGQMDHGQHGGMSVEKCAKKIIRAMVHKRIIINIARNELLLLWLKKFLPYFFYKFVVKVEPV